MYFSAKKQKKSDFRVPLGTLKGGPRTNFFGTFSALEAQGVQKAPRCPPRGPRDRPRPRFLLILNGFLTVFRLFLNNRINVEAEAQREEQKKRQHSVLFLKRFWWERPRHSTGNWWHQYSNSARWREGRRQVDIYIYIYIYRSLGGCFPKREIQFDLRVRGEAGVNLSYYIYIQ